MEDGSAGNPDNVCQIFFNTISPFALQKLMALFGNQNQFTFAMLVQVFKGMKDQKLACEKFIIFADAATPNMMRRHQSRQMEVALTTIVLGDHYNQLFPEVVTLEKIRNWVPLGWQQTFHPCITAKYEEKFILGTLTPIFYKLFSPKPI